LSVLRGCYGRRERNETGASLGPPHLRQAICVLTATLVALDFGCDVRRLVHSKKTGLRRINVALADTRCKRQMDQRQSGKTVGKVCERTVFRWVNLPQKEVIRTGNASESISAAEIRVNATSYVG